MKIFKKVFIKNFIRSLLDICPKIISNRLPTYIIVESSNRCMLKCPLCATSQSMKRPKGDMSMAIFSNLVEQIDWKIKMFSFSFAGEPLMNPELFDMISLAWEKKRIFSCIETNGMLLANSVEKVFNPGLKRLSIALDGMDQGTLVKYRIGADFYKISSAIEKICQEKQRRKINYPEIVIQFMVMQHNEDQINDMIEYAKKTGVDEIVLKTLNLNLGYWLNNDQKQFFAQQFLPRNGRFLRYKESNGKFDFESNLNPLCYYAITSPAVLWNGDVILCCSDFNGKYKIGNILEKPVKEIWRNEKLDTIRKNALSKKLDICQECTFTDSLNRHIIFKKRKFL